MATALLKPAGNRWKLSSWQPMETIQLATNGIPPAGNHCQPFGLHFMESIQLATNCKTFPLSTSCETIYSWQPMETIWMGTNENYSTHNSMKLSSWQPLEPSHWQPMETSIPDPDLLDPRVFWLWCRIRILLSSCKNNKKNLESYYFVTLFDFL